MSAAKLRERMRQTKYGWHVDQLDRMVRGYGFERRAGGSHWVYTHPVHRRLRLVVRHSDPLPVGYITAALHAVDEAERLDREQAP